MSFEIAFVRFMASTEGRLAWKYDVMLVKEVMFDEKRRKIVVHDFDANVAILGICADRSALTRFVSFRLIELWKPPQVRLVNRGDLEKKILKRTR